MKKNLTIFVVFSLLAAAPAFGQTSLLVARTFIHVDGAGVPFSGDSTTLAYNSQLLVNQLKTWKIDASGNWALKSRTINQTYDANENLLYYLFQAGDDVIGWTDSYRYNYSYDMDGREISSLEEKWNGAAWVTQWSVIRVYDANGNQLSSTGIGFRYVSTYDAQNLLQTKTYQELILGNWVDKSRVDYTYLPNNTTIETSADWINGAWLESERNTFNYDASGNLVQHLYESWNGSSWIKGYLESNSYDVNGYIFQNLVQDWNGTDWVNTSQTSYTYDAENNLTYWIISNWSDSTWVGSIRQFNGYDDENHFISARLELWDGAAWGLISYGDLYYSDFVSTNNPLLVAFEIFPNPASTSVTLKSEGLLHANIFDQQGRPVRSQNLHGQADEILQVGNLPSGNYFLQVIANDGKMGAKPLQIRR